MAKIKFKAETIKGEIIEACCVINKHKRLLLSNEDKPGSWIECRPNTLEVCDGITSEREHANELLPHVSNCTDLYNEYANSGESVWYVQGAWNCLNRLKELGIIELDEDEKQPQVIGL